MLLQHNAAFSRRRRRSAGRLCYVGRLSARENVDRCTVTQRKTCFLAGTRCFVLLALNHRLLVAGLETNNSKEPKTPDQTSLQTFF